MGKRRYRSRAILGAFLVLLLAAGAGTVFVLVFHQARSNSNQKKVEAIKKKNAVGVQLLGTVTAATANSITVTANGKVHRLLTTRATRVEDASHGSNTDPAVGERALLRMKSGSKGVVQEILVLPSNAHFGLPIVKTGFGYVWLRARNGHIGPKIRVVDTQVDHATHGALGAVKVGTKVLLHAQPTLKKPIRLVATEVVLLPSASVFVQ